MTALSFTTVTWFVYVLISNAAIIDVVWSSTMGIVSLTYLISSGNTDPMSISILTLIGLWMLRLVIHLSIRLYQTGMDGRYKTIDQSYGDHKKMRYFIFFFTTQGFSVLIFTLPVLIITVNPLTDWGIVHWVGVTITTLGLMGESISDYQLSQYKRRNSDKKSVCNVGFWYYSRHPNYFFEWLFWLGLSMICVHSSYFTLSLLSPLCMYLTLVYVTGIPPSEKQALKSRKKITKNTSNRQMRFFVATIQNIDTFIASTQKKKFLIL